MEKRVTCAKFFDGIFDNSSAEMCKHCSGAKFEYREENPHWECEKYKTRLNENKEKRLLRCEKCLENSKD